MATDVFFEDGSIKITGTEATFGPRTYDLDQVKDVYRLL